MVSLYNMHYSAIYYDIFRSYKWAIIRLLVEPIYKAEMFRSYKWAIVRLLVEPIYKAEMFRSYKWAIIRLLVEPIYKAETCRCILHCNAYYIVIPSLNCCVSDCMYM